jgi:hypothetical protein
MLTKEQFEKLRALAPILAPRGVTGLSIFGSRVTGTSGPESDLDVIVDYDRQSRFSLIDLAAVGRLIEERLGIQADVMTRPGLHPLLKSRIEAEAVRVF